MSTSRRKRWRPFGRALAAVSSPLGLAALHVMTTLTGSVLIALGHAAGALSADEAWDAAHVDERHQERPWGEDAEAMAGGGSARPSSALPRVHAISG